MVRANVCFFGLNVCRASAPAVISLVFMQRFRPLMLSNVKIWLTFWHLLFQAEICPFYKVKQYKIVGSNLKHAFSYSIIATCLLIGLLGKK